MGILSGIGKMIVEEFTFWQSHDVTTKKVADTLSTNHVIRGGESCGGNTYRISENLGFSIDCSQPIGERITIGRYQPIIPFVLGIWRYFPVTAKDYQANPVLASTEIEECK